ncbi:type VI secretion system baseplate subunit TssE [Aestuariispira ectoiniformans]|uniref:type VI secretion system baseplate subunit TssE n=1 Tax=Aestuariispira ectoiniformans TaxID=2775080 RepID=UPI00223BC395|nr:type VI secretion system baseplate subunit TssE [Aestuariispira ectoiniformans]
MIRTDTRQTVKSVRARSLLERVRADDLQEGPRTGDALSARVASIKNNLLKVLNGRQGGALSAPGFGLRDFNDASVGSSDMLRIVAGDIRKVIETYEPRVSNVVVNFDRKQDQGLDLFFQVSARTTIGHAREQVMIDLVLSEGRTFSLRMGG